MNNLSIIVPVWNEEENIKPLVNRIHASLKKEGIVYEIIFVDDNSTDNSEKVIKFLQNLFPISYYKKQGKKGKAYSLIEGFQKAKYEVLGMIDADLQYPPEALVEMLKKIEKGADVVVAKRQNQKISKTRRFVSNSFRFLFGRMLFGLDNDIQAGLKVFKKRVLDTILFNPKSGWTFDLEFLNRAKFAGFVIYDHEIEFEKREKGESKISLIRTVFEIGINALILKTQDIPPLHIPSQSKENMIGAGVGYNKKQYTTHTSLKHKDSALKTLTIVQKIFVLFIFIVLAYGFLRTPLSTLQILIAILSAIYFLDVVFNFYVILKSLHKLQEVFVSEEEIKFVKNSVMPIYSILCPLYKEAHVLPHFLKSIDKLEWPKEKLDVLLLLEEDDTATIKAVEEMKLPSYVRSIIVPNSQPKTKPKACNYGLSKAKGDYVVIYDAEDMPDPMQLKKAYIAFQKVGKDVACLQAKLNYYNPHQNLLTRLFTAEYSLWFDVTLTGLQSLNTSLPLGGTSNHFRTKNLLALQGWDPFNVTEDADLGIRLFKRGYKTAIIDSVTLEEANSELGNWIRQRSRWIKGYMQTYLVHTREFFGFRKTKGFHGFIFHLIIGGKIAFILINPILWIATILYFTLYSIVGPTIESLYPSAIFYMAATSLVVGNFLFIYYYMIGCAKRDQWNLIKFVFFVPLYWLMISLAGVVALFQLIFKPHYWEKTVHGLHLTKNKDFVVNEDLAITGIPNTGKLRKYFYSKGTSGTFLIFASFIANFINFVFNVYLGRKISVEEFGLVSLISSFQFLSTIPIGALSQTISYRSAFLLGKYGTAAKDFWLNIRKWSLVISVVVSVLWILFIPLLTKYFYSQTLDPFITFAPIWIFSVLNAVDRGYLTGSLAFLSIAVLSIVEAVSKLAFAFMLIHNGYSRYVYISIPLSVIVAAVAAYVLASMVKQNKDKENKSTSLKFPKKFFVSSLFTKISGVAFLSFDVILANHFLPRVEAGEYALLSLTGKMIFYIGTLFSQFITPLVSKDEGAKKDSKKTFYMLFLVSIAASLFTYLVIGIFGYISVPILLGPKTKAILYLLPIYGLAILGFTITNSIVTYYQIRHKQLFPSLSILFAVIQVTGILVFHQTITQIVLVMAAVSGISAILTFILHISYGLIEPILKNFLDFISIFETKPEAKFAQSSSNFNILIFNWRDTKHKWAGGAEVYIQEVAKRWVKNGDSVTIFCGNDGKHQRNEVVDGIQVVRRGGFYTVYFWAFVYYVLKFKGKYDVIIDSENGIPFFTPIYVRKPVFILVHHIHQEVFRNHLIFPLSTVARFLEGTLMPAIYKNSKVITISESSKKEILKIGLAKNGSIDIVNPGIEVAYSADSKKTIFPSFVYLGRLKEYKNVDIAIKAFAKISSSYPDAKLYIAGFGESLAQLKDIVARYLLSDKVEFLGRISEEEKSALLAKNWAMVQPSTIEGWGITVIEANACKTPVIASNVNGLKDSIVNEKTGILVDLKNITALAEAMLNIARNQQYRYFLSKNAYEWSQKFDWNISADKFREIIGRDLGNGKFKINLFHQVHLSGGNN